MRRRAEAARAPLAALFLAMLAMLALLAPASLRAQTRSLRIPTFDADYHVQRSGNLIVSERIEVEFSGSWNGVYRMIPIRYHMDDGSDYTLALHINGAKDENGTALRTETSREGAYLKIKMWVPGAQDATHTVTLAYTVDNALRFFDEHDELYWNVTGNGWEYPIESVTARVFVPAGATGKRSTAYTGVTGARGTDASYTEEGDVTVFRSTRPLGLHEGMTIVHGWDPGLVTRPTAVARVASAAKSNAVLLFPIAVFLLMSTLWRRYGKDPAIGVIVTKYEPPGEMSPAEAGTLIDMTVDNRDIAATLVDLAVRGHIRINQIENEQLFGLVKSRDYRIDRITSSSEWATLKPHERQMLNGLFTGDETSVEMNELRNVFYTTLAQMKTSLLKTLTGAGYYRSDPNKTRGLFLFAAIVVGVGLAQLAGLFAVKFGISAGTVMLSAVLSGAIIFAFGWLMPARTLRGTHALRDVLGFQEFLSRVEGDRMKRIIDRPELFEKYLPYAMAFSVDKQWAAAFDGILTTPPGWYTGTHGSAFRTHLFVNDLNRMTAHASTAMSSAPRSSSGSGFSSGGGFSGGGFGGGGGGGF